MMHAQRWQRVRELFDAALDRPPAGREAWVHSQCAGDEELAGEVLALLRSDAVEATELPLLDARPALGERELSGATIAGYRVLRRIGEGGMGTVYEAQQQRPQRTVALKTLAVGLGSERARRRFEDEAEILARLRHPSIAQVLDAGTARLGDAEVPWFAMELVEQPRTIDRFVREEALEARAIAAMFATVCDAVHHGHQRGVIHRDLKPANVLVDAHGQPKVIDFGIARFAGDGSAGRHTRTGELLGTLAYMSPERLEGSSDGADTAADVYALGVVLYELLSGRCPFPIDGAPPARALQILRDFEPAPPSRLIASVPVELDWITAKAMARERGRRYASAGELAQDLGRCLRHEPVVAGPPSATYRLRKLAWRHRLLLCSAAVVFVALAIGFVVAALGWRQVTAAERLASRRAATLLEVNRFQERILRGAYGTEKGRDIKLADVVAAAERDLEATRFGDPIVEAGARNALGTSCIGLGRLQDAERHLLRARAVIEEHDLDPRVGLAVSISTNLGVCYREMGKLELAEREDRRALADRLATHAQDDPEVALAQINLAVGLLERGSAAEALELATLAHRTFLQHHGEASERTITAHAAMARALDGVGRGTEAARVMDEAQALAERNLHAEHPARLGVLTARAAMLFQRRLFAEHERTCQEIAAIRERSLGPGHPKTLAALSNLATGQAQLGNHAAAEATLRRVAAGWERMEVRSGANWVATMQSLIAIVRRQGRAAEAESLARSVRQTAESSLPAGHWLVGIVTKEHGGCLCDLRRFDEAEAALLAAHDMLARALQRSDYRVQRTLDELVALYEEWQRPEEAARWRAAAR
jgi:tetratricopeptide (TPR) repeat protein